MENKGAFDRRPHPEVSSRSSKVKRTEDSGSRTPLINQNITSAAYTGYSCGHSHSAYPPSMAANGNFWVRLPTPLKRLIAASFEQAPLVAPQHPAQNTRILPAAAANQTWKCVPHGAVDSDGYVRYGFADGAEGLVNVWCLVDNATQHIIDRVVIKQVHPGQVAFSDPLNWTLGAVGGQPREARMSDNVTNNLLPGDRMHVASCLGYGDVRGNPRWRYRLYFEFAEEGNLRDLIMRQRANNKTTRKLGQKTFPEPFLWMVRLPECV
jgi:hypothetical protein